MIRINEHWYLCVAGKQPKGPYAERDIVRSLREGKLSWSTFACNPAIDMPWTRLIEVTHFQEFLPEAPTLNLYSEILSDFKTQTRGQGLAQGPLPQHVWFLQCNGSQFGPMTIEEAQLLVGQISFKKKMYAWKQGLAGWIPAEEVEELRGITNSIKTKNSKQTKNRRAHERARLLASVVLSSEDESFDDIQGICRDLSVGGLFIVTHVQLPLHTQIKIFVQPVTQTEIKAFTADGRVVSLGQDDMGMGIQFTSLARQTEAAIAAYIQIASESSG